MSSHKSADDTIVDFARDVPTSAADVAVLARLRRDTPSWFSLSAAQLEALIPEGALDRRPVMRPDARPFTLP
jgi:hypothetical protein